MYDTVHQVFQDIIAPQIEGLKGEMTALRAEQRRLDEKMDLLTTMLTKRLEDGLTAVRAEINAVRTEIGYTNRRLDEALEIRERLATLEAKVAAH
jgi:prefoldin subunit 5